MNLTLILSDFELNRPKTDSKSNKSNYKFRTKILNQNVNIIQIKYI